MAIRLVSITIIIGAIGCYTDSIELHLPVDEKVGSASLLKGLASEWSIKVDEYCVFNPLLPK